MLVVLAALCIAAVVYLAHEVTRAPQTTIVVPAAPVSRASIRVVMPAGVAAPPEVRAMDGAPELPAPTVPTLATMPTAAPEHPETLVPPNPTAPVATGS